MELPRKIDDQVTQYFPGLLVGYQVRRMLKRLWRMNVMVGPDQLAEAILVLSGGQIGRVRALFASNFQGDPRDVLVAAEEVLRRSRESAVLAREEETRAELPVAAVLRSWRGR